MSKDNPVRVVSPLGDDLLFRSMEWVDEISRLSVCNLDLLSLQEDIELDDLLGKDMTIEIDLPTEDTRYYHGYVSEMSQSGKEDEHFCYSLVLRPWLWFLTRTADCRIFQEMTVPDIIKEIFREAGFSDFEQTLSETYRTWEYCVQYRETDFNFVSRLMEQEGIYYYFKHENGKDVLVMGDSYSAHDAIPGYEKIPYYPPSENVVREEHIYNWSHSKSVRTGKYALTAYDFKNPRADLSVSSAISRAHEMADYEVFDYPGEYFDTGEGELYVKARIQELQALYERVRGETDAMGLYAGGLFSLTEFPRDDQNREYLICSTRQSVELADYESSDALGTSFSCSFGALSSKELFRPERRTPKPTVHGLQSAIVTGPSGEEIYTDEYGRVKVQFTWDRLGENDENSSCWMRVAQVWAGAEWGGMTIPRIGQEVLVNFIEGDPDRPIITGRVYNDVNMPPYELPANKTQSGIKSRSSKDGSAANFNEIRFEDMKGSEEMYIHAEKDQNIVVENDKGESVGNDNSESIGHDETIDVGNDRTKTVGNNQSETIGVDKTISVGSNHKETIGANKNLEVGANHTESIGSNMTINVASNLTETVAINYAETVGAAMELTVGAAMTETVAADKSQTIGKNKSETIGSDLSIDVGKNKSVNVGDSGAFAFGKKLTIDAGDEITIATGKAKIVMKKDGTINIMGKDISIKGSGAINVKASKDIVMKGKKILEN